MSRPGDCDCPDLLLCMCSVEDASCFTIAGKGTPSAPFVMEPVVSSDADNLFECNPSGMGVFCPSLICDPPRAKVKRTADQTIATSTPTLIVYDTEVYDSAGMVDVSGDPGRIRIVQGGLYIVHLTLVFEEPEASAYLSASILYQPSTGHPVSDARYVTPANGDPSPRLSISGNAEFDEGTWLETQVFQNTGFDLLMTSATMATRYVAPQV